MLTVVVAHRRRARRADHGHQRPGQARRHATGRHDQRLGGNDTAFGFGGNDNISGGAGNDALNDDGFVPCRPAPGGSYCTLSSSETVGANDRINGDDGDDRIEGGLGNHVITGGLLKDVLNQFT